MSIDTKSFYRGFRSLKKMRSTVLRPLLGTLLPCFVFACAKWAKAPSESTPPASNAASTLSVTPHEASGPVGPYLGQAPPGVSAELFAPGIVSTGLDDLNAAFHPDMKEFFFSANMPKGGHYFIFTMKQDANGVWSRPQLASFSGQYSDADPTISPDGSQLYFISKRPLPGSSVPEKAWQIWTVPRNATGWGDAVPVGAPVNGALPQIYVSVASDKTLYYTSPGEDSLGGLDLYRNKWSDGRYLPREHLGAVLNSSADELNPVVSPDQSTIIFASARPEENLGSFDLYMSKFVDGQWTPVKHLENGINSPEMEYCPMLSPDGKYLFFSSYRRPPSWHSDLPRTIDDVRSVLNGPQNGLGDVYWVSVEALAGPIGNGRSEATGSGF